MRFIFWKRDLRDEDEGIKISVVFIYFFRKLNSRQNQEGLFQGFDLNEICKRSSWFMGNLLNKDYNTKSSH
jgi:hypothetical protein